MSIADSLIADLPTTTGIPVDLPVFVKSTGSTGGSNFSTVFCCQHCFLLFFRVLRKNLRECRNNVNGR